MSEEAARAPEVLSPAGDPESLRAAIRAGADAVYFGLQGFNARARAANFDAAGLDATLRTLHAAGVRGYVTLNTLVFDAELPALEAAARACAEAGADAVIVQDLGVARLVRAVAPELPIHASTQMTCTDAGAVELARELGASRVILARELSLDDIAAIRRSTTVELEVFVHGALCIAYSGQCLSSEAIGGRSANRGACAQACRLPYELVVDGAPRDLGDRAYLLSPQDLEASALVPALVGLGVSALKIEGRLKGPDYVGATTALYRRAVDAAFGDGPAPDDAQRALALATFDRGSGRGFLRGVDHQRLVDGRSCDHRGVEVGRSAGVVTARGKRWVVLETTQPLARGQGLLVEGGRAGAGELGGRIWELEPEGPRTRVWLGPEKEVPAALPAGRRVFRTSDPALEARLAGALQEQPHRVALDLRLAGSPGQPPVLEARSARGARATVTLEAPLAPAPERPITPEVLRDKLGRLGDTTFALRDLALDLPAGVTLPLSALNRARRAVVAALADAAHRPRRTTGEDHRALLARAAVPERPPPPPGLFVLCRSLAQARAALAAGADGVYLDLLELTGTGEAFRALRVETTAPLGLCPPRVRKPGEDKIDRYLDALGADTLLVRGLGALREPGRPGPLRVGDFSLNVTNRLAAAEVLGRGLAAFTPALDLDAEQLIGLLDGPLGPFAEVVVHHPVPLFHMEHCVIAALLSDGRDHRTCGRPCDHHRLSLRDRAGMDHPVEADVGCRNTVFHAAAQSAASLVPALRERGVGRYRIELVREDEADVARVVGTYRALCDGGVSARDAWQSLRAAPGYGVVRGSLRVLRTPPGGPGDG